VAVAEGAARAESFGLRVGVGDALAASLGLTGAVRADKRGLAGETLLCRRGLALGLVDRVTGLDFVGAGF
jgi:hypothetical protein